MIARQLEALQLAIADGAMEMEMAAAENVFDMRLSTLLKREASSLYQVAKTLNVVRLAVVRARFPGRERPPLATVGEDSRSQVPGILNAHPTSSNAIPTIVRNSTLPLFGSAYSTQRIPFTHGYFCALLTRKAQPSRTHRKSVLS